MLISVVRYKLSGQTLPGLRDFMQDRVGINLDHKTPAQPELLAASIPQPILNEAFMLDLKRSGVSFSDDPQDRLFRAHGKSLLRQKSSIPILLPSFGQQICLSFLVSTLLVYIMDSGKAPRAELVMPH